MPEGLHPSTHPPLPPTTEDDRVLWLRLLRSRRVGIAIFFRLLSEHGSPAAALDALPEIARAAGVERYQTFCEETARAELSRGADAGATLICYGTPEYPVALYDLSDPPPDPLGARRYLPPEQTLHRHGRCAKRFLSWRANGAYVGG